MFNIPHQNEPVATDTIMSNTTAVDDQSTMAQFFCQHDTLVCDAYGIKNTKQLITTLSNIIWKQGAIENIITDGRMYEIPKEPLTSFTTSSSEPYYQHEEQV